MAGAQTGDKYCKATIKNNVITSTRSIYLISAYPLRVLRG